MKARPVSGGALLIFSLDYFDEPSLVMTVQLGESLAGKLSAELSSTSSRGVSTAGGLLLTRRGRLRLPPDVFSGRRDFFALVMRHSNFSAAISDKADAPDSIRRVSQPKRREKPNAISRFERHGPLRNRHGVIAA
jgi:hypothetical protein